MQQLRLDSNAQDPTINAIVEPQDIRTNCFLDRTAMHANARNSPIPSINDNDTSVLSDLGPLQTLTSLDLYSDRLSALRVRFLRLRLITAAYHNPHGAERVALTLPVSSSRPSSMTSQQVNAR